MFCPDGSVKTSDQPLTAVLLVFAMVRFAVSPVFQALVVQVTRQPPAGGWDVGGWLVGGWLVGGWPVVGGGVVGVVPPASPRKSIAYCTMPLRGSSCPAPWTL